MESKDRVLRTWPQVEAALHHGVDIHGRRIFLHGGVEEDTIAIAIRGLYILSDIEPTKPIELFVSSYGGDLDEAFALHDVTRTIRAPVHTVALGKCQSAAPLLVACGKKGERWVAEHTQFMLHDVMLENLDGPPAYVASQVKATEEQMKRLAVLLAKYSSRDSRFWTRIFAKKIDSYFNAEEAMEWGLVDQVWSEKD